MNAQVKTGQVYLQPRKAGKKWKLVWLSLYLPSSSGVGRLEIQDMRGGGVGGDIGAGIRRHHQPHGDRKLKVVRLSEVISVLRLPPNAEACPMENMSAFCVETEARTMVFAAVKDECVDWLERLCHSAFQRGEVCGSSSQLHMEENQIYASTNEASEFWVVVQQTDAAARCGLHGAYWLQVGQEALVLREPQKRSSVKGWPYRLLRRYGKDKMTLSIEAGRRCDSGPGTFTFETEQANKIFSLIENAIKQQKASAVTSGNQYQEGEKVMLTNRLPHSPLPKIPDMTTMTAILENDLKEEFKKSTGSEESVYAQPADSAGPTECVYAQPADSIGSLSLGECVYTQPVDMCSAKAPISLLPLPMVPTHYSPSSSHPSCQSEAVYADPVDLIHSVPKLGVTTAVYVDPASYLPIKPPSSTTITEPPPPPPHSSAPHSRFHADQPDPIYSEVYDKVSPVQNKQNLIQNRGRGKNCFADDEPIYSKPVRGLEGVSHENDTKPDPFAHLYAQVCKTTPCITSSTSSPSSKNIIHSASSSAASTTFSSTSPSSSSNTIPSSSASSSSVSVSTTTTKAIDQSLSDVIYENLGII